MSDQALELSGVSAAYGRIEVLNSIDLSVPSGSVLALIGPNGSGKSTILKVASGRLRPKSGTVTLFGERQSKFSPESFVKKGVIAIPEGRGIFPNLTVKENIWMWTYQGGVSKEEAEQRSYERFPILAERRTQHAGTLSGGEQQMLALARVVVGNPKIVMFDELSMGLAPLVVEELYDFVGELAKAGTTIVVVEQFVTTVLSVATQAAIILHGKVHATGTPDEMASAALDAYLSTGASA